MKSIKYLGLILVASLLLSPLSNVNAAHIVGIQGGFIAKPTWTHTEVGSLSLEYKSTDVPKNAGKFIGGYFEFDYHYALDMGLLQLGIGPYLNYAATKYNGELAKNSTNTQTVDVGLSLLLNFTVIPIVDIYLKPGLGLGILLADKDARLADAKENTLGANWRLLLGLNFKVTKMVGVFIEGGYVGHYYVREKTLVLVKTNIETAVHGAQVGAGIKLKF